MEKSEKVRACYLHACLKYVNRELMTNTLVRARFGMPRQDAPTASRIIKEAVDAGVIFPVDADAGKKLMKYVPWWAIHRGARGGAEDSTP